MPVTPKGQQFPKLDSPIIDEHGNVSIPWYRFFISLWQRTGGSTFPANIVTLVLSAGSLPILALSSTMKILGQLFTTTGGMPQALAPGASPFVWQAPGCGFVVVESGKVEISRGGVSWYQASVVGGEFVLVQGDFIRLTWYGADAPKVTFFP